MFTGKSVFKNDKMMRCFWLVLGLIGSEIRGDWISDQQMIMSFPRASESTVEDEVVEY